MRPAGTSSGLGVSSAARSCAFCGDRGGRRDRRSPCRGALHSRLRGTCCAGQYGRRAAALFQGGGTVLGAFLPVVAMVVYLAVSLVFIIEPLRRYESAAQRGPAG